MPQAAIALVVEHLPPPEADEELDESPQGAIHYYADDITGTYYVHAEPNYSAPRMAWLLDRLESDRGLTIIDPDDEPGTPMPDGSIRIYFERKESTWN